MAIDEIRFTYLSTHIMDSVNTSSVKEDTFRQGSFTTVEKDSICEQRKNDPRLMKLAMEKSHTDLTYQYEH